MFNTIRRKGRDEQELLQHLAGLDRMIASREPTPRDRGSRSAHSFLRELRRDTQDALELLRVRQQPVAYRR
jgi:hypothetical protein